MTISFYALLAAVSLPYCTAADLSGRLATAGPRTEAFDAKAYAEVRYVSLRTGADTADGSRAHPWRTPVHALEAVRPNGNARAAILIAEGVYAGATISLKPGIDLFGGFEAASWRRDIRLHPTVLDGESKRRVVVGADRVRLDGFVIRNGHVRGQGGGLLADGVAPAVSNNVFQGNSTVAPENWKPKQKHETANDGGAIAVLHGGAPTIAHNLFAGNSTEAGRGGALACVHSAARIEGNIFLSNLAGTNDVGRSSDGGAISLFDRSNALVAENLLVGNRTKASNDGGGIFVALWSAPVIRGNTIVGSWGDDDGGALFVGGQEHHYDTPLDPIPPASAYLVRIDDNLIAGNDNSSHNAGVARLTMQSRVEMSGNIAFENVGGLKIETSGATLDRNLLAGAITVSNTSKASHVLPGPVVLTNDVIAGPVDLQMEVEVRGSCGPGLPAGSANRATAPEFADDAVSGRISAVHGGEFTTTLSVSGPALAAGALAGRVIRIGDTWTVVKANDAGSIEVWGAATGSPAAFHVAPSYRLRPGSSCASAADSAARR